MGIKGLLVSDPLPAESLFYVFEKDNLSAANKYWFKTGRQEIVHK